MKKSKFLITIGIFALLMAATFYVIFKNNDIGNILKAIQSVNPFYIAIAIVCALAFVFFEGCNSHMLLNELGEKTSLLRGIKYASVGFFFSSITPSATGGQPMQVLYMKRDNVPITKSSLVMILELISYQIVVMLLAVVFFFLKLDFVSTKIGFIKPFLLYGLLANGAVLVFIVSIVFSKNMTAKICAFFVRLFAKLKIIKNVEKAQSKVKREIAKFTEGIDWIKSKPILFLKVFMLSLLQLSSMYSVVYFIYRSLGFTSYSFAEIFALKAAFNLAICALPLPGGMGISEASFVKVFSVIFTAELATSAMLIDRGLTFYMLVIITCLVCIAGYAQYRCVSSKRECGIKFNSAKKLLDNSK